jgi:carbonic anhydrase
MKTIKKWFCVESESSSNKDILDGEIAKAQTTQIIKHILKDSFNIPKDRHSIELLNSMFDTNKAFTDNHDDEYYKEFKKVQSPHTTYVGCSDSRVHLNSISENPKNEIFSIRNIGNQLETCQGSVDYGIKVLNTPFLIIIGHSDCGAVRAVLSGGKTGMPEVDKELSTLELHSKNLNKAIRENVNTQVETALIRYKDKIENGSLNVFGMIYDFKNTYKLGYGKLVLVNANGNTSKTALKKAYVDKVKNLVTR